MTMCVLWLWISTRDRSHEAASFLMLPVHGDFVSSLIAVLCTRYLNLAELFCLVVTDCQAAYVPALGISFSCAVCRAIGHGAP